MSPEADIADIPAGARRVLSLGAQPPVFAERVRATVITWRADQSWFDYVMHAPGPHAHPGATEIFVVLEGAFELATGPETFTMERGDVCLIPPEAVHDPLGSAGSDLALLSIVSPNRKGLRSVMSDRPVSDCAIGAVRAHAAPGPLPSNHQLESAGYEVAPGEELTWDPRRDVDRVLVVVDGEVDVVIGPLRGRVGAGSVTFVPARAPHAVVGRGEEPAVLVAAWATGLD